MQSLFSVKKNDVLLILQKFFPILVWLPQYNLKKFRGDLIAGLTCGVIVIPQSIAFANLAQLPPQNGLYASLTPGLIYSIFGTSKDMSTGPTVSLALYTSRFNPTHSTIGASLLSFLVGDILLLMGIFKLGFLIKYVPQLVISAFVSATAITIIVTQFSNLLGIKKTPQNVFEILKYIVVNIKLTNTWDLTMSVCCLAFLAFFVWLSNRKLEPNPKNYVVFRAVMKKVIWFLCAGRMALVCLFATIAVYIFSSNNVQNKFSIAGNIPRGMPHVKSPFQPLKVDNFTTKSTRELIEGFGASLFVLPIIMFIEQMSIAKAFGRKFNYKVKAQQELIAIGVCNIVASFYGGWTVGGSFSRSAVNSISGAQTPLTGLISGVIALIALQLLTPAFYYIPSSALGAMMLMAVLPMIEISMLKNIWKLYKWGLIPFFATFCVSFYKLEYGVLVGTGISLITMISRQLRPKYLLHKDYQNKCITLLMLENLTYPGLDAMNKIIHSEIKNFEGVERLFLDMSTIIRVDFTILKSFEHLQNDLTKSGLIICFINFSRESIKKIFLNAGLISAEESDFKNGLPRNKNIFLNIRNLKDEVSDSDVLLEKENCANLN